MDGVDKEGKESEKGLREKHRRFVAEYLVDLNATQAAIRAGYGARSADRTGGMLLRRPDVQAAVRAAQADRATRTRITADRVLEELARIAFVDIRRVFRWGPDGIELIASDALSEEEAAVVAEIYEGAGSSGRVKGKRFDKLKALELLGRHLGIFSERVRMDVQVTPADILKEIEARRRRA